MTAVEGLVLLLSTGDGGILLHCVRGACLVLVLVLVVARAETEVEPFAVSDPTEVVALDLLLFVVGRPIFDGLWPKEGSQQAIPRLVELCTHRERVGSIPSVLTPGNGILTCLRGSRRENERVITGMIVDSSYLLN